MQENPSEILVVFLKAVIKSFNVRLVQESKHTFFKLPRSLARNNFYQSNLLLHGFSYNPVEFSINREALVINIM